MDHIMVAKKLNEKKKIPAGPSFINIKGIAVLAVLLAAADLTVAFGVSPLLKDAAVTALNKNIDPEVSVGTIRIHPLFLSVTAADIEVRDPVDPAKRMFSGKSMTARLSLPALLSKKIYLSALGFKGFEFEVTRDENGVLNVEKLAEAPKDEEPFWKRLRLPKKRDWFGTLYEKIKASQKKDEKKTKVEEKIDARVRALPHGSVVSFESPAETVFKIGKLRFQDGKLTLREDGQTLPAFENILIDARDLRWRRSGLMTAGRLRLEGEMETTRIGTFDVEARQNRKTHFINADLKDIDLSVLKPVYEDSLPVIFEKGFLSLESESRLTPGELASKNHLTLEEHQITASGGAGLSGFSGGLLTKALNRKPRIELDFRLGGTPEKPSFEGFQESLFEIVKDDLMSLKGEAASDLKEKAGEALGELGSKVKSFFNR